MKFSKFASIIQPSSTDVKKKSKKSGFINFHFRKSIFFGEPMAEEHSFYVRRA